MTPSLLMTPDEEAVAEWLLTFETWGKERAEEDRRTEGVIPLRCGLEPVAFDFIRRHPAPHRWGAEERKIYLELGGAS
ncbi:hypothetical protein ACFV27_01120 [Streptomyces antimycoticus]|uniref:hypothetical protein n=1 Tax=Streptomyces antimycoticus TaxID=68175 RepID=UPI0036C543E3